MQNIPKDHHHMYEQRSGGRPEVARQLSSSVNKAIGAMLQELQAWIDSNQNINMEISSNCKQLLGFVQSTNEHFTQLDNQISIWLMAVKKVINLYNGLELSGEALLSECVTNLGLAVYGAAAGGNVNGLEKELFGWDRGFIREGAVGKWCKERLGIKSIVDDWLLDQGVEVLESVIRALIKDTKQQSLETIQKFSRFVDIVFLQVATLLRLIAWHYSSLNHYQRHQFASATITIRQLLMHSKTYGIQLRSDTAKRLATCILPLCAHPSNQLIPLKQQDLKIARVAVSNCLRGILIVWQQISENIPKRSARSMRLQSELYSLSESVLLLLEGLLNLQYLQSSFPETQMVQSIFAVFNQVLKFCQVSVPFESSSCGGYVPNICLVPNLVRIVKQALGMHEWLDLLLIQAGGIDLVFRIAAKINVFRQKQAFLNCVVPVLLRAINRIQVEDSENMQSSDWISLFSWNEQAEEIGVGMYIIQKLLERMNRSILVAVTAALKLPDISQAIQYYQELNYVECFKFGCCNQLCQSFEGDSAGTQGSNVLCHKCGSAAYCCQACMAESHKCPEATSNIRIEGEEDVKSGNITRGLMMLCQAAEELESDPAVTVPRQTENDVKIQNYSAQNNVRQPADDLTLQSNEVIHNNKSDNNISSNKQAGIIQEGGSGRNQEFSFSGNIGNHQALKKGEVFSQNQLAEDIQQVNRTPQNVYGSTPKNLFQVKSADIDEVQQLLHGVGPFASSNIRQQLFSHLQAQLQKQNPPPHLPLSPATPRIQPPHPPPPPPPLPHPPLPPLPHYQQSRHPGGSNINYAAFQQFNRGQNGEGKPHQDDLRKAGNVGAQGSLESQRVRSVIEKLTSQGSNQSGQLGGGPNTPAKMSRTDEENFKYIVKVFEQHCSKAPPARTISRGAPATGERGFDVVARSLGLASTSQNQYQDPGRRYNQSQSYVSAMTNDKKFASVEGSTMPRHQLQNFRSNSGGPHRPQHSPQPFEKHTQNHHKPIITTGGVAQGGVGGGGGGGQKSLAGEMFIERALGGRGQFPPFGFGDVSGGKSVGDPGGKGSQLETIDLSNDDIQHGNVNRAGGGLRNLPTSNQQVQDLMNMLKSAGSQNVNVDSGKHEWARVTLASGTQNVNVDSGKHEWSLVTLAPKDKAGGDVVKRKISEGRSAMPDLGFKKSRPAPMHASQNSESSPHKQAEFQGFNIPPPLSETPPFQHTDANANSASKQHTLNQQIFYNGNQSYNNQDLQQSNDDNGTINKTVQMLANINDNKAQSYQQQQQQQFIKQQQQQQIKKQFSQNEDQARDQQNFGDNEQMLGNSAVDVDNGDRKLDSTVIMESFGTTQPQQANAQILNKQEVSG